MASEGLTGKGLSLHFYKPYLLQWSQVRSNGALQLRGKQSSLLAKSESLLDSLGFLLLDRTVTGLPLQVIALNSSVPP